MKNRDRGSSSIIVLAIVMFLSIVFLSMGFFIEASLLAELEHKKATDIRKLLIEEAREVVKILQEDMDRENDTPYHPVWDYVNTNENIELKDVGSYLNPNWIDPKVFDHIDRTLLPPPNRILKDTVSGGWQDLVQYWYDYGIHLDIKEGYKDFFEEDIIEEYMTPYSFFNINLCYQHVLKKLCYIRTGSERDANSFERTIDRKLLKDKKILDQHGRNGIERWFLVTPGVDLMVFKKMYPVLNAAPVLNVHFVPEEILRSLLSYKDFGIQTPDIKADTIMSKRENEEDEEDKNGLTTNDLKTIIRKVSKYPGPRIYHYLGVYTNFWEIRVTIENMELRWVLARVPPLKPNDDPYYKLIEERIGRKAEPTPVPVITDEPDFIDDPSLLDNPDYFDNPGG